MPPTRANGKICYIEMPASDIARSAEFYKRVFGWNIRQRGDGHTAFDDTTGEVSGTWVLRRPPASAPGLLLYVMVDSVAATVELIVANGGDTVRPIGATRLRSRRASATPGGKRPRPVPATRLTEIPFLPDRAFESSSKLGKECLSRLRANRNALSGCGPPLRRARTIGNSKN